jgi:hypothetical protein
LIARGNHSTAPSSPGRYLPRALATIQDTSGQESSSSASVVSRPISLLRIPKKELAAYLNLTPETLSRLKQKKR